MSGVDWMECHCCGGLVLESDEDGLFWDGQEDTCQNCGVIHRISCDSETPPYAQTDELAEDIGQPSCDNDCGDVYLGADSSRAFIGTPCRWDCPKTLAWRAVPAVLHQPPRDLSAVHPVRDHDGRRLDEVIRG